ncbi:transcription-repair coupling factor [Patescibacteria group bacterium]|nr:transcription-repair coupling factor [Patescibacteria group bacterium]MBU1891092.1 transcription-repair coupling factor [Patescibacteria group bacterium]
MNKAISLEPSPQGVYAVSGVPTEAAKTYLLSHATPNIIDRGALWLVKNSAEVNNLSTLLKSWPDNKNVDIFTLADNNPSKLIWHLLKTHQGVVILPLDRIDESVVAPKTYEEQCLALKPGLRFTPAELAQKLVLIGYDYNTKSDCPGVFSRRGNVVDIYPAHMNHPVRFEFGQMEIKNIAQFHEITGKTIKKFDSIIVTPQRVDQYSQSGHWYDYLKDARDKNRLCVYTDPDELGEQTNKWSYIEKIVSKQTRIVFHTLPNEETQNSFNISTSPLYHNNTKNLARDIKQWNSSGYTIYFPERIKSSIAQLCQNNNISTKQVRHISLVGLDQKIGGFVWSDQKVVWLTQPEIFGQQEKQLTKKKRATDLSFISELKPGDYVVHLDHGIGRFKGLVTNEVDKIIKEYFLLEYALGDKLSIPIELAYKIDKYIGSAVPKIHRLSNTSWSLVKRKVKAETKKIGTDLLKLYAQRETVKVEPFKKSTRDEQELSDSFAFEETPDQIVAIREVMQDLESDEPMDRLICGDVGFGKTEVAIRAAFKAVANGKQVAVLSPTTILAQQHFDTFNRRLKKFPVTIESLSRFKTGAQQKDVIARLKTGEVDIVIGTHRLISGDISFKNLGLIIIDEEQRFGVRHKEKLKSLRINAHILTLTATPIPRTLNLSLATIRNMSVIRTPPEGRQAIETIIRPRSDELIKKSIEAELARKGQAYFLYNRVETIKLKAEELKKLIPNAKIGIIHGQLPEPELVKTMSDFDNKKINVLVSTTIIENGLDLPNVNTLIVEDATRFGLAQLYQLRGRIGRGNRQAYAYFLYPQTKLTGEAKKRLQAILEAKELGSGFQLALRDLEIRGVGNILGREQHGRVNTIGLSLYSRLLNQAIEELKTGQPAKQLRDIAIDLPLPITIPKDYVTLENQRLKIYRELSDAQESDELEERFIAVSKQFGPHPPNLKNLYRLLLLKLQIQNTNIASIDTIHVTDNGSVKPRLVIKFITQYTPDQIAKLLKSNPAWILGENQIKIDFESLGKKWFIEIEQVVNIFKNKDQTDT